MARVSSFKKESGARRKLGRLFSAINNSYNELIKRGRDQDAFRLRDATRKFAAAGSKFGVNQFARTAALNDLKAEMQAASGVMESKHTADKLRALAGVADSVARVDQMEFQQGMAEKQFDEGVRRNLFSEGMAEARLGLDRDKLALSGAALNLDRRKMEEAARQAQLNRRSRRRELSRVSSPAFRRGIQRTQQLDPRVIEARANIIEAEQAKTRALAGTPAPSLTALGMAPNPRDLAIAGHTMRGGGGFLSRGRGGSPTRVQSPVARTAGAGRPLNNGPRVGGRIMSPASPIGMTPLAR